MDYREMNPYIRYAMLTRRSVSYDEMLYAYDHRLFYVMEGNCRISVEGTEYALTQDCLLLFPPKLGYRVVMEQGKSCLFALLNFDLDSAYYGTSCRAPDVLRDFDAKLCFSQKRMPPFDAPFFAKDASALRENLKEICKIMQEEGELYRDMLSAMLKTVLLSAIRMESANAVQATQTLEEVRKYIETHCTKELSNREIAAKFGYHPYYLSRKFAARYGYTLHAYEGLCKIKCAQQKLLATDLGIAEIALQCGYKGASWFSECFKQAAGITPTEYRRRGR